MYTSEKGPLSPSLSASQLQASFVAPTLVTRIFFPIRLLHELQGGYIIGWNINDFTACVMCLVQPEEYSYDELTAVLSTVLHDESTSSIREYCGGSPVVIGYLEPKKFKKIPNLETQKQTNSIWITMSMELSAALEISGRLYSAPVLKSIYCCGCRHATSTQVVLFDDVNSNLLHYLSRNHSAFIKQSENPSELVRLKSAQSAKKNSKKEKNQECRSDRKSVTTNGTAGVKASETYDSPTNPVAGNNYKDGVGKKLSELDFALHQINSMYTFKKLIFDRLRSKKANGNLKEADVGEDDVKASCCSQIIIKPFIAIFVLLLLFCKFVIKMLSARMPSQLPFFGGKALRELSVLAHVLDIRLRTLCHLPFLFYDASEKLTKTLHIEQRNERHFIAFSELVAVIIDIFVGGFVGFVLFHFSKRSDFVLELLHYGGHVLHMDVLTESTKWLMGVPAGLKLNTALTEWIGTLVLAVLDLWNLVTTQLAALEPTIVLFVGACGIMGISIVLAVLVDMVHCVTVHILLIYSVFASVHSFMLKVIASLWHLFRGRKRNILRNRVDTLDFSMERLLLGTILFTILVFLFPTFAVYYLFFLTVWMTILLFQAVIWLLLTIMTTVPFYAIYIHMRGSPSNKCLPGAIRLSLCQPILQKDIHTSAKSDSKRNESFVRAQQGTGNGHYAFTAATSANDGDPKHFVSQTAESNSNSSNIHTNITNDRYADVTHLRLKGVPVGFGLLLQKFFSYISAWYKHYHPVRIIQSSLVGKFIRPLPFLLRSKSIILSDNLPSQEDVKKCLYD